MLIMGILLMKIKRFDIVRLPYECESNHPVLARLTILANIHKLIKFVKIQPTFNGANCCKPYYRLYVPRIRYTKGGDAL